MVKTHTAILAALLILNCICIPSYAGAWPEPTVGGGFGVAVKPYRTSGDDLQHIKQAGFSYVRYDMQWWDAEKKRGEYSWQNWDGFIARVHAAGLKSVIIISGGAPAVTGRVKTDPTKTWGYNSMPAPPITPEGRAAFARFAAEAVARYGTKDIIWEIWNEPDNGPFWPPKPDPAAYAALAAETCQTIKSAYPEAVVIGPALSGLPSLKTVLFGGVLREFLQSPASKCFDAVSVHPYRWTKPPEDALAVYENNLQPFMRAFTPAGQKPLPVINSEWGYPLTTTTPEQQAAYALRIRLIDMLAGVPLTILYEWKSSRDNGQDDPESNFGIHEYDGTPKAFRFIEKILPQISSARLLRRIGTPDANNFVLEFNDFYGPFMLAWVGGAWADAPKAIHLDGADGFINGMPQIIRGKNDKNPVHSGGSISPLQ